MSIQVMKMALNFCEDIGEVSGPYPYLDGTTIVADSRKISAVLRQAIDEQEETNSEDPTDKFIDESIDLIAKHNETLTLSTIIGCLEIIKHELLKSYDEDEE